MVGKLLFIKKIEAAISGRICRLIPVHVRAQLRNFQILSKEYGQYQTIRRWECVDKNGKKIPWYTYPAIEYLNGLDFSQQRVFEYGSGNSSAYWAKKTKSVYSVEHDKEWYSKVKGELSENQAIELCETEESYLSAIDRVPGKVDVIVIDGKYRDECAKLVKEHISDDGIVILDNSDWYKEASRYLRDELDLLQVDFHGFGPINDYTWTTSIFYKRTARLKPIDNIQPVYSICAIKK